MPVTNTETGMTLSPELRLFALVNDSGAEDFGFAFEKGVFTTVADKCTKSYAVC